MGVDGDATVGKRIAFYRRRRGLTQEVLSGLLGRTVEWLSQIERGYRDVNKLSTIVEVADALGVEPVRLLPRHFTSRPRRLTLNDAVIGTAPDTVPAIKSAMFRYDGMAALVGVPDRPPADQAELYRRIDQAFRCSQTERWSALGPLLPDLVADGWHAAHTSSGDEQRRGFGLLSLVYRVTSGMLDRIGEPDLPWIAAERDMAAERSEDALLIAGAAWRLAVVLRHSGRLAESTEVPLAGADVLREDARTSPAHASVYGALMLKGAVGAASLGDHGAVRDHLAQCHRAAELVGPGRNDFWFAFSPTNVAIHRVWLELEMGDPIEAIARAGDVDHRSLPAELAERAASHLITLAWSHYLRRHDDEALTALLEARQASPEQLMFTSRVHAMIRQMLRRDRRNRRELRNLASFVGVE